MNKLKSKKISYKLLNVKLMDLQKTDDGYVIKIEESFEQTKEGKSLQTVTFNKSYTANYENDHLIIVDMKETP
ncbi:TcaA NTF2-like domain-containing protein [Priestia flexa]